jgi:DNA-binding transcriptional ArsR family regulator
MDRPDDFELCARQLKALADPARLRILKQLFAGPRNVTDLAADLNDEIVKISHHLGVLRNAGIVEARKAGRFVEYTIHPDVVGSLENGELHSIELGCCRFNLEGKDTPRPDDAAKGLSRGHGGA